MTYFSDRTYIENPLPLAAAVGALAVGLLGSLDPAHLVPALVLVAVCVVQNTAFSLVSRSRNRDNKLYHAVASVGSNGVYFATLAYMVSLDLAAWLVIPYVVGTVCGSLVGADLSMWIERKIGATSDGHLKSTPPAPVTKEMVDAVVKAIDAEEARASLAQPAS